MIALAILLGCFGVAPAQKILIPMDQTQTDHLKAYGIAYLSLASGRNAEWLLNYRGGSFLLDDIEVFRREASRRGVFYEALDGAGVQAVAAEVDQGNSDRVMLEKAPKMAVYTPPSKLPWDDAVTLVLTYAEIPFDKIYDREVVEGQLRKYDWLHLHHEDFTGQQSKFYSNFRGAPWYIAETITQQNLARELGFPNNVVLKKAVALAIRSYVEGGGFLFAMCSATTTLDIALATVRTDAVASVFDGSPPAPDWKEKVDYSLCLAFTDFHIDNDPLSPSHSDIDFNQVNGGALERRPPNPFILAEFSPKYDPVPAMLVQDHVPYLRGFYGLATSYGREFVKRGITILAETQGQASVRYLHGTLGEGQFTYFGGHDPEDVSHLVGDAPTDLSLHPNSPGYRLMLNNVLFPAARKKQRKT